MKNLVKLVSILGVVLLVAGCTSLINRITGATNDFMAVAKNESTRESGNGKTPATAIIITPDKNPQNTNQLEVTVEDNILWFYVSMKNGLPYTFETVGSGDPMLILHTESHVSDDGVVSGEGVARDNDGGAGNRNAKLTYTAPTISAYYLELKLEAGSSWKGSLKYQVN